MLRVFLYQGLLLQDITCIQQKSVYIVLCITAYVISQQICPPFCNNMPPPTRPGLTQLTCIQYKEQGQCDQDQLEGFCECTCGRCCPCNESPPPGVGLTCRLIGLFKACTIPSVVGYCQCTCGNCIAGQNFLDTSANLETGVTEQQQQQLTLMEQQFLEVDTAHSNRTCRDGQFPIINKPNSCESHNCAINRQMCTNSCGKLRQSDFSCKDRLADGEGKFRVTCTCE
eukprot:TRINITY_DN6202_c0_g1_i1.p1 TRINITY_DN6202_c0_g1~~TRINITY_DN6202_c0_g1_i1.p1  ORF type:complete len:258 (-),score=0.78 TRINITY_DN6202_c0_g1_i1:237-917(-)